MQTGPIDGAGNQRMNRMDRRTAPGGQAELEYLDGEYRVKKPGAYVVCAATGAHVPLAELQYWNVDRQEPYAGPAAKMLRLKQLDEIKD
jgi:hypothetical protein